MDDADRWQRAKAYIEREIEYHQRAIDAGGLGFDALRDRMLKRDIYQTILDRAEGGTMADKCEWREDLYSSWLTECGEVFDFAFDGPEENGFMYCPFCRLELFAVDYVSESEDE